MDDDSSLAIDQSGVMRWGRPPSASMDVVDEYGAMVDALRVFLDRIAAARPSRESIGGLTRDLERMARSLEADAVLEDEQVFGKRRDLFGRGQTMVPRFEVEASDDRSVSGQVTFGRYFLGAGGAVHGGAIPLLFDEVMGRLSGMGGRPPSRTAYLHVNFRAITPIDVRLDVSARFVSEEGRKSVIVSEIRNGDTLCADAEGLFIAPRAGL